MRGLSARTGSFLVSRLVACAPPLTPPKGRENLLNQSLLKFVGYLFPPLVLTLFIFLNSCGRTSTGRPLSAGTLLREYQQSRNNARQKYDGKEISVRGLAQSAATLPLDGADQGLVWLQESVPDPSGKIGCWFSSQQAADFSKIVSGQHVTIKGVFNGEAGVELKFCRLVKVE